MLNGLFQCYFLRINDFPVYNLSKNLVNSLIVTNQNNINTDYIKFPNQTTYLSFGAETFSIYHPDTGEHNVYGAFITQHEDETFRHWRVLLCGDVNENSNPSLGGLDDCVFFYRIKFFKNQVIENTILDGIEREGEDVFTSSAYLEQMKKTIPFIANVALYLNTDDIPSEKTKEEIPKCLTQKPKKIKRWQKEYGNKSKMKYYSLGENIKNILDENYNLVGNSTYEKMTHTYTWIVRGHWHLYWVGKGRAQTKINWLQPYWKKRG